MKKIKIYILSFSLLLLGACSDSWLDSEPIDKVTESNFYRTPNDAYNALVGCYDGLQRVWASGISFPVASEVLSDNVFAGGGASDDFKYTTLDQFDGSRSAVYPNLYGDNWVDYYKAIYRCNMLIGKMDQVDWGSDEDLRYTYESEARFLRAYLYFDMVRLWGNIPLVTEPTTENIPQANPDEVYQLIAEDLKFAADNMESPAYGSQSPETYGRVTKWAAEALLARVYLYYTGYFGKGDLVGVVSKAEALAYVEDVIANGGFGLVENFAHLWPAASVENYAGEGNQETVFAIKYTYTSDYDGNVDGNHWMVMFGIREQAIPPYGNGWGFGTVNPKLWETFNNADTRKTASIISIEDEELGFEKLASQRDYTGYYIKKYAPMSDEEGKSIPENLGADNFQIGQFQDYVSIRYADVLLMAAELGSANAQVYFDEVRRRAYQDDFTSVPVTPENILKERQLELAFEGHRYWDLLRQGIDNAAAVISETTSVVSGGVAETITISGSNIRETKGLQQIPYTQITLSDNELKQNSGW